MRLLGNVHVSGQVDIGEGTRIFPFATIGLVPQDLKWKDGGPTAGVKIGKNCVIREHATVHQASKGEYPTTIGDKSFLMVGTHMAHDSKIGNSVVLVNNVLLAGHAEVGDNVTMGGGSALHQFNRIGRLAFISGLVGVSMDVPPFCVAGARNTIHGLNLIGLRRAGVPRDDITMVRKAFRKVFRVSLPRKEMLATLEAMGKESTLVAEMAAFVATAKRAMRRGRGRGRGPESDEGDMT